MSLITLLMVAMSALLRTWKKLILTVTRYSKFEVAGASCFITNSHSVNIYNCKCKNNSISILIFRINFLLENSITAPLIEGGGAVAGFAPSDTYSAP